jgi:starvation-inducible DNA-binding protein
VTPGIQRFRCAPEFGIERLAFTNLHAANGCGVSPQSRNNCANANKRIGKTLLYKFGAHPIAYRRLPVSKEATTKERRKAPLETPTDLGSNARRDIAGALNALLADTFALYIKTKNFHWHVSGPHFRSLHLLFDEHGDQIFAMTDEIAERVRKVGGLTIHSIGEISRLQRIPDNDADYVDPLDMVSELRSDNQALLSSMREAHELCDEENDVATASLLENWIDQTERRIWFLFETSRRGDPGH